MGRATEHEGAGAAITDLTGTRAVGCAAGGSQVPGRDVYSSEQKESQLRNKAGLVREPRFGDPRGNAGPASRWALCVSCCGQGFRSTNRQREALRNEGDRRTPLLQFKKTPIRPAKSAFPNAYLYRVPFSPRARGTSVESPGYRC